MKPRPDRTEADCGGFHGRHLPTIAGVVFFVLAGGYAVLCERL